MLLNIDFKTLSSGGAPQSEGKSQKNKDKYKRAKQKIIDKRQDRKSADSNTFKHKPSSSTDKKPFKPNREENDKSKNFSKP